MNKSLISDLLKTPSQIRQEEQAKLQQQALQRQQSILAQGAPRGSLFGGVFTGLAAQAAGQLDPAINRAMRGAGEAFGVDMRSSAEKQAALQQQAMSEMDPRNLTSMKRARDRLVAAGAPAQTIMQINQAIATKEQAVLDTQKQTLRNKAIADQLRKTAPELAVAVENGSIPATEAMKIMYQNKYSNFKEVDGTLINLDTLKPVYTAPEEAGDSFVVMTREQIKAAGLDPSLNYQKNTKTGKISVLGAEEIVPSAGQGWTTTRIRNEDGSVSYTQTPTEGGPVAQEIAKAQEAQAAGARSTTRRVSRVGEQITRARSYLEDPESSVGGKTGAAIQLGGTLTGGLILAGTDQQDLLNTYSTIKAGLAFDEIKRLTEQNPNGTTGLGPISNVEFKAIQDAIESLDPTAKKEVQLRNLEIIEENYDFLMTDIANKYTDDDLIAFGLSDAIPYRTKVVTVDPETGAERITYLTEEEVDTTPAGLRNLSPAYIEQIKKLIEGGGDLSGIASVLEVTVKELKEYVSQ